MYSVICYLLGYKDEQFKKNIKDCIITPSDLQKVVLKPPKIKPAFARNMPKNSFYLIKLNKEQLHDIIHNKLKPTPKTDKKKYIHRHPVLRELLEKTQIIL